MDHKTIWTNDFGEKEKQEALALLKEGKAVRVGSSCIGHTRAYMVRTSGERFLEEVGAKPVEIEFEGYALGPYKETYWKL